jgi:cytochrome c biogenesis protein CcdA/thiol-disulfide isomerase/thioredoxin
MLPIILGGSLAGEKKDRWRPYIITASLVVSLIVFTILLKASTALIGIDPRVWSIGSGLLVVTLGIFMLFPMLWAQMIGRLGIEHRTQGLLGKAYQSGNGTLSAVLIGAALGPVFSSCSPTYAWVIATVLPESALRGVFYLAIYCLGVASSLLAIALLGRRLLQKIKWAANPGGWFQRAIAVLFILVGIFVATGWDKKIQTYLVDKDILNLIQLEQKLVPSDDSSPAPSTKSSNKQRFNIAPYDAPDFTNIASWLNSEPLTLANVKGKVVLVDFWTYSCINCQRTQPYLNAWYSKYKDAGFEIIGVHAPEFAFEKVPENVKRAIADENILYPVALDNDFATWRAYRNQYWPAKYLVDKDGQVRYTHFGEGAYDETERTIQALLKESGNAVTAPLEAAQKGSSVRRGQTPETYLGYDRAARFMNTEQFVADKPVTYTTAQSVNSDSWSLGGSWQMGGESSQSLAQDTTLTLKFSARYVHLVMSGPPGARITTTVAGQLVPDGTDSKNSSVTLDGPRLYTLVSLNQFMTDQTLKLTFPAGVTINAFTFGS